MTLYEAKTLYMWNKSIAHEVKKNITCVKSLQSCLTLCDPMDYHLPGSSVHGILQTRILEWVAICSSRGSSQPKDWTGVSWIAGGFFTSWAIREALCGMNQQNVIFTWSQFSLVQSLSRVWLFATPWIAACQASLSITNSRNSPRLMWIKSVMPSSHLILCHPLLLLPPIPPSSTNQQ